MENQFLKEIEEQPKALYDTVQYYCSKEGEMKLSLIREQWQSGKYDKIVFTGMGSSFYVSQSATTMLTSCGVNAYALSASELLHYQFPVINAHTLLVCISQSGESYEIVQLLKALSPDIVVVGISNEKDSTLVRRARYNLLCFAGKEEMTSTKTFVCTYLVTYIFAQILSSRGSDMKSLLSLSQSVSDVIKQYGSCNISLDSFFERCVNLQFIARGVDFATASQSALMFMEATQTFASAMLGGEFRHGPLEMVGKGFCGVILANSHSVTYDAMLRLVKDILHYGGKVIFVTDKSVKIDHSNLYEINVEAEDELLWPIVAVIPIQMMVIYWAKCKGIMPGDFSHGAKVTITE